MLRCYQRGEGLAAVGHLVDDSFVSASDVEVCCGEGTRDHFIP
jgi:hypothetical protein